MYFGDVQFKLGIPIIITPRHSSFLKSSPSVKFPLATQNKIAPSKCCASILYSRLLLIQ